MITYAFSYYKNTRRIFEILRKNDYPAPIIKKCIREQTDKLRCPTVSTETERNTYIYKTLTNANGLSEALKRSDILDKERIRLAVKSNRNVGQLYSNLKTKIKDEDKSNLVYEIKCNGDGTNVCNKVYVGTTKQKLKTRISAHKSDQRKITENLPHKTALADHCIKNGHTAKFDEVKILEQENNYSRRLMLEMLHIINVPAERRINYKADIDNCANAYKHLIRI